VGFDQRPVDRLVAEQLRAAGIGLEFLAGELQGSHDPSGVVFTVLAALSGMEREYIRDRTLEGHESARARGKARPVTRIGAGSCRPHLARFPGGGDTACP